MVIADFSELIHRIARYIMDIIRDEENEQGIAPENPLYILENILPDICFIILYVIYNFFLLRILFLNSIF